jgi:hypothetical protein
MKAFKSILIGVCLVSVSALAYGDSQISVFGKFNAVPGYEGTYEEGVNDFPIVSDYQNYGLGLGLTFGKTIFAGIEGHYNFNGKAILTDPSDGDTVQVDTYRYASGFFTLGVNLMRSRTVRLYINGGGGIRYNLDSEIKTYTSELGYETEIDPPEKKYLTEAFGGVGVELYFSPSSGVVLNGRYSYVNFESPQTYFVVLAGVVYRF